MELGCSFLSRTIVVVEAEDITLSDYPSYGIVEREFLMLHDERYGVSAFSAYCAVPGIAGELEPHRRMPVIVHEAPAPPVVSGISVITYQQLVGDLKDAAVTDLV